MRKLTALSTVLLILASVAPAVACEKGPAPVDSATGSSAPDTFGQPGPASKKAHNDRFDWVAYHGNGARTGRSTSMPYFKGRLRVVRRIALDGQVYASPLIVDGKIIVATENNTVYEFGPKYGLLWKHHFQPPSRASQLPCGDIDPLGMTGTPIYLRSTNLVYVASEYGLGQPHHALLALNVTTGRLVFRRAIDLPGADPTAMQQRAALAASGRRIWVAFGGLAGDCGNYKGRAIGVPIRGKGKLLRFQPSTHREGGIWAASGPTVHGGGRVWFVSGNGSTLPGDRYDHTDAVSKVNQYTGRRLAFFAPRDWAQQNAADLDLGATGLSFVGRWAVIGGKSADVYVLRPNHLGGIGGQVTDRKICAPYGGAAVRRSVIFLPCSDGVRAVRVTRTGGLHVLWHASSSMAGSPVVGGGVVYTLDTGGGTLYALGLAHGRVRSRVSVGTTTRFATPALSGRRIVVPTQNGITVVTY